MQKLQCLRLSVALLSLALAACGAVTDAGSGSKTLEVQATLSFDATGAEGATEVDVLLANGLGPVAGAKVRFTDLQTDAQGVGIDLGPALGGSHQRYGLSWPGYHARVGLEIAAGSDSLNCKLEGPSPHTIRAPEVGARLKRGKALQLRWATRDGLRADRVALAIARSSAFSTELEADSGRHRIAPNSLSPGPQRLSIGRETRVVPAGAQGASFVRARYSAGLDFQLLD